MKTTMKTGSVHPTKYFLLGFLMLFSHLLLNAQTSTSNVNLALGRTASASSLEAASFPASNAFDGDLSTRFSSGYDDNAWISIDLAGASLVKNIVLVWQHDYGKDFDILFSNDGSYTDLYNDSIQVRNNSLSANSLAGTNTVTMKPNTIARYVRMQGIHRATGNGYSLFEFQVMGISAYTNTNFLSASFTGFNVSKQNSNVMIDWTMLIELNTSGFSIERSSDAINFESVGWVNGQNRGNIPTNYSFIDNLPMAGKNYYRIKQEGTAGDFAYSEVILVTNVAVSTNVKVYPIPAKDYVMVAYQGTAGEKITINISNAAGQPVYTDNISIATGQQHIKINRTAAMNAGMYFLTVSNGDGKPYMQQLFLQ
jgi:hypothetical protein